MQLLVVDDEPDMRRTLELALRLHGHDVATAASGAEALGAMASVTPDALVLDVLMPGVDGFEVCRRLRAGGDRTPILLLTARDAVVDRVGGLDAGADDYMVKPFALEELMARLRAITRRYATPGLLRWEDVTVDPALQVLERGGRQVTLSRTEFLLIELLIRHPRQVMTRELIFDRVWGCELENASNTLDVHISRLRRKLETDGQPRVLHTVRGLGYVLRR